MTGPLVDASALVMHQDGAVQMEPLTCGMRTDCDWRNDYHRSIIARFVWALDRAIKSLKRFYDKGPIHSSPSYDYDLEPFVTYGDSRAAKKPKHAIECLYPYQQSYEKLDSGGVTIPFKYLGRMSRDLLLFKAIEIKHGKSILIKFTRKYNAEMHRLLAEKRHAPQLYGCQVLPGGWTMIAMEWLPEEAWVTLNRVQDVKEYVSKLRDVLEPLWEDKWVHGDIRHRNILVPTSGEIDFRLIDFDSSGKEDVDRYPRDWNYTFRPEGAVGGAVLKVEHDKAMLGDLSIRERTNLFTFT